MYECRTGTMGIRLLDEAQALRAAFPDVDAMGALPVSAPPPPALRTPPMSPSAPRSGTCGTRCSWCGPGRPTP